jgi:molybdopterin converting factor small subunit
LADVKFSGELQPFTGVSACRVKAGDYRSMIDELCARFPGLDRDALTNMAVAIDGVIIVDPLLEPLNEDSEVHFLHFVAGG